MKKYEMKCYEGRHPRRDITEEFVKEHKLNLARSQEEIIEKIEESLKKFFSDAIEVLILYLERDNAKKYYMQEYIDKVDSGETKRQVIEDVYEASQDFLDYMVFGRMKALDERGLSASRSIEKLSTRMRLLGRDDLVDTLQNDSLYNPYGMPALIKCCEELKIEVPQECKDFALNKC